MMEEVPSPRRAVVPCTVLYVGAVLLSPCCRHRWSCWKSTARL